MSMMSKPFTSSSIFTFQSGYIQIDIASLDLIGEYNFTFQSGYIQIAALMLIYTGLRIFTFQSGYIQMMKE